MNGYQLLSFGVCVLALILGYMVAASGTPVASVAIPAAFGIAVSAIGLLLPRMKSEAASSSVKPTMIHDASQNHQTSIRLSQTALGRLGVLLISFSIGFGAGLVVGAKARLSGWLLPAPDPLEPTWIKHKVEPPPNAEAAYYWLSVQDYLRQRGVSDEHTKSMYELQAKDWSQRLTRSATGTAVAIEPRGAASSVGLGTKPDTSIQDHVTREMSRGAPIVQEPPKKPPGSALPS